MSSADPSQQGKDRALQMFVDAQGPFRQMRRIDDLPRNASPAEIAAKLNLMALEAEEAGIFPRESLTRIPTDCSVAELKEAWEMYRQALVARFPDHRLGG